MFIVSSSSSPVIRVCLFQTSKIATCSRSRTNQLAPPALMRKPEASMLDLRLVATSLAMLIALLSAALADPAKDQAQPAAQGAAEARPIRVILPAPWEPATKQAQAQSVK
ncbi:hypothetical protein [Bradyrhizobium sp. UNPF46]|uniref:hypothetical protein n=1 Tax=Bradyrhizobium sp. UNPF46 TaxID=1141168 RepID=UPI00114F3D50|nr:hypothetical protein [Bradyrhizobium sp. UNPF46]